MMPTREVHWQRWQVVAAFFIVVLLAAVSVQISGCQTNRRIDKAEKRIATNRDAIEAERDKNTRQNIRREVLVAAARSADRRNCREIEKIKERIRATVRIDIERFRETLTDLNIDPDSPQGIALLARSRENEREVLERFRPRNCMRPSSAR